MNDISSQFLLYWQADAKLLHITQLFPTSTQNLKAQQASCCAKGSSLLLSHKQLSPTQTWT